VDFLDKKPPEPMQLSVKLAFETTGAVADGRPGAAELWQHERKIAKFNGDRSGDTP
jgi:hypothetical protein